MSYKDSKEAIKSNAEQTIRSVVATGFYIKHIKEKELYGEDGYTNIYDFSKEEIGLSRSEVNKYIRINDEYSVDGNSPILLEQYKGYRKSILQEMLYLSDEQLEQVTEATTVVQIRKIKNPEKVSTSKLEETQIEPEIKLSALGKPKRIYPEGSLLTTQGCEGGDCFSCARDCQIREEDRYCVEAPMGNPFYCNTMYVLDSIENDIGSKCMFLNLELAYHRAGDHEPAPCCKECLNQCGYACSRAAYLKTEEIKPITIDDLDLSVSDETVLTSEQTKCDIREQINSSGEEGLMCSGFELDQCSGCDKYDPAIIPSNLQAIDNLELSVSTYNCLKRAGIDTINDLCKLTKEDVTKIRNIGRKDLNEIKLKLSEIGKELNSDKPVGEDGCTGECFWCTDEKCNCHQELRENCLFDANIKCSIYGARQVATTTCGIDCKSNCCMNCSEDCGARCNHSAHFGLMKSTVVETVELIPEAKKSDWEKGIFEDDTEAYGWSRSTTVISLIEQLIADNVEVDNINGDYCEAHGNTYYVYIVNGYIEFEDEDQELLFKTDINRFKHEFEWHKKRLETMPDLSGDEEPEDDIDESENDEPKIVDNEPKSENDIKETDPEEIETIEADIIQSEPEQLPDPIFSAEYHLREAIQREEEQLNQLGETWKRKQPDTFLKHETILIALKCHLTEMEYPELLQPEVNHKYQIDPKDERFEMVPHQINTAWKFFDEKDYDSADFYLFNARKDLWENEKYEFDRHEPFRPEFHEGKIKQPELPILKNNDQRKEWIDNFETWPIWIDVEQTGERYYRYDFDSGVSFVIRVSIHHKFLGWDKGGYSKTETEYGHEEYFLLGGTSGKYEPKEKTFAESGASKSMMTDYLKEVQKK